MKRLYTTLAGAVMSLALAGTASAALVTYQFDGTIDGASMYDGAGIMSDTGLTGGSAVEYTIGIDTDADAYYIYKNGTTYVYPDISNYDYFYADLLGTPMQEKNGGYFSIHSNLSEYNIAYAHYAGTAQVYVGTPDSRIVLSNTSIQGGSLVTFEEWLPGTTGFRVYNIAYSDTGAYSSFYADLTLTSVTGQAQASVPEPSTLLLLGSGISGLGVMRWRMRAKKA